MREAIFAILLLGAILAPTLPVIFNRPTTGFVRAFIRRALFGIAAFLCILTLAALVARHLFKPNLDQGEAVAQATTSMHNVGGVEEVREAADRAFAKFGASQMTAFYSQSELKEFPALTGLGKVCYVSNNPACIRIREGSHFDGYTIEIYKADYAFQDFDQGKLTQLAPGIYVHR